MSLTLSNSNPAFLVARSLSFGNLKGIVTIGEYKIPMKDFVELIYYVLTNTDLEEDDPRLNLLERIKLLEKTDGWNKGRKKLSLPK